MNFHEEIESLLHSISNSDNEATKAYYLAKLEAILETYVQDKAKSDKINGNDK